MIYKKKTKKIYVNYFISVVIRYAVNEILFINCLIQYLVFIF